MKTSCIVFAIVTTFGAFAEPLLSDLAKDSKPQEAVAEKAPAKEEAVKAAPAPAKEVADKENTAKKDVPAPVKEVAAKAAPAKENTAFPVVEEESDDVDLEGDDSATAAKGKPVVSLAPKAEEKKDDSVEAQSATAAPQSGSDIAKRFLASDETALVDITSDDATLTDILRQFRKATGANIIYAESSNLQQRVSVSLKHVPWLQAMSSILNSRGFRVESSAGIHFVKEDKLVDPIYTRSFLLNHASAEELAKLFNTSYGTVDKDGKVIKRIATAFSGANTVVVTASERTIADCERIVHSIDRAVPQIYIEARFIELSNQSMHKLGMQWNQLESWGASVKDVTAGMEYANGRSATYRNGFTDHYYTPKQLTPNGISSSDGKISYEDLADGKSYFDYRSKDYLKSANIVDPKLLANDNAVTPDMAWRNARVFSGQLSVDDFYLAMSAFEKMEDARIFSNPKIIVSNGKQALVDMTTKYPNVTVTSSHDTQSGYTRSDTKLEIIPGEDGLFSKTAFFSWGITLTVKPRISPDGLISVEIVPSISELDTDVTPSGFYQISGGTDAPYGAYPIIRYKRLTTDFTMKDGATAVIGGLSKTEEGDVDSGIPYLREIPWIGNKLFGWKSRGKVQKEIVVFVTVGIADPANLPEDIGLPKNAVRGREYVEGRSLEPGDRKNASIDVMKLDMRPMDQQHAEYLKKTASQNEQDAKNEDASNRGTVTITPVVDAAPVAESTNK